MKEFTLWKSLTNVSSVASDLAKLETGGVMKEFTPGKNCVLADHRALIVTRKSTVENTRINVIVTKLFLKVCLARVRGQ